MLNLSTEQTTFLSSYLVNITTLVNLRYGHTQVGDSRGNLSRLKECPFNLHNCRGKWEYLFMLIFWKQIYLHTWFTLRWTFSISRCIVKNFNWLRTWKPVRGNTHRWISIESWPSINIKCRVKLSLGVAVLLKAHCFFR